MSWNRLTETETETETSHSASAIMLYIISLYVAIRSECYHASSHVLLVQAEAYCGRYEQLIICQGASVAQW